MKPLRLRRSARAELLEAIDWYDAQAAGLGDEVRHVVVSTLDLIGEMPGAFNRSAAAYGEQSLQVSRTSSFSRRPGCHCRLCDHPNRRGAPFINDRLTSEFQREDEDA